MTDKKETEPTNRTRFHGIMQFQPSMMYWRVISPALSHLIHQLLEDTLDKKSVMYFLSSYSMHQTFFLSTAILPILHQ